jgi:hypothetical protein
MKNNLSLLAFILVAFSSQVSAEIYKRVDADGRVTYSNIKSKGATQFRMID